MVVEPLSWDLIRQFVATNIAPGSEVRTDGVSFYRYSDWSPLGVSHVPRVQKTPERAGKLLPWVHQVIGNLKTWLHGTHHGRMEAPHFQEYLDEYTFRFTRRGVREHGFLTLLLLAAKRGPAGIPHTRHALVQG
ncbi:MAG: transposase [Nitrospirae bacterium]|nr:transposase [Nitrospirota bacterium]